MSDRDLPHLLTVNCRRDGMPSDAAIRDAAALFARVECRNVPNPTFNINLDAIRDLPRRGPHYDRDAVRDVERLYDRAIHESNLEERLGSQVWVRGQGRPSARRGH